MASKIVLFFLGSSLTGLGLLYLVRPEKIFQINAWIRDLFLNDAYVNLHRKRIGVLLVLLGLIVLSPLFH